MPYLKKRVLVIDDDIEACELMRVALGVMGYDVAIAQNAADALSNAASQQFDLYLTDNRLLDRSGVHRHFAS